MAIVHIARNVLTSIGGGTVLFAVYVAVEVLLHPGGAYADPIRALSSYWCGIS
jgi:hypothetical protein